MPSPDKLYQDPLWLVPRWEDPGRTIASIAKEAGCSAPNLHYWAERFGCKFRRRKKKPKGAPYKQKDTLYHHYWELKWSMKDIAKEFGTGINSIKYWMSKHGIPTDPNRHVGRHPPKPRPTDNPCADYDFLYREYWIEQKSMAQIADEIGYNRFTVRHWLKKHKIPLAGKRPMRKDFRPIYHNPTWLYEHYITREMEPNEIAQRVGTVDAVIRRWIRKHNIPIRRPYGDAPWHDKQIILKHIEPGKPRAEVARELGCSNGILGKWMERFDIEIPLAPEGQRPPKDSTDKELRSSPKLGEWRIAVFERDDWKCQMPGCGADRCTLCAHHIKRLHDFNELAYEVTNGIALCESCHTLTLNKEERFEHLFIATVETVPFRKPIHDVPCSRFPTSDEPALL